MKPTVYMLVGISGSGKTKWRNDFLKLSDEKWKVLSTDDHIEKLADKRNIPPDKAFPLLIKEATNRVRKESSSAFDNLSNVIWDQTSLSENSRKKLFRHKNAHRYKKICVDFTQIDKETILDRLVSMYKSGKHIVDPNVLDKQINKLQKPSLSEGFDEILTLNKDFQILGNPDNKRNKSLIIER